MEMPTVHCHRCGRKMKENLTNSNYDVPVIEHISLTRKIEDKIVHTDSSNVSSRFHYYCEPCARELASIINEWEREVYG